MSYISVVVHLRHKD